MIFNVEILTSTWRKSVAVSYLLEKCNFTIITVNICNIFHCNDSEIVPSPSILIEPCACMCVPFWEGVVGGELEMFVCNPVFVRRAWSTFIILKLPYWSFVAVAEDNTWKVDTMWLLWMRYTTNDTYGHQQKCNAVTWFMISSAKVQHIQYGHAYTH